MKRTKTHGETPKEVPLVKEVDMESIVLRDPK